MRNIIMGVAIFAFSLYLTAIDQILYSALTGLLAGWIVGKSLAQIKK